jgi:hypothetical protein
MSFFDFLDKLRAKPIHVRKQIAMVTTSALSLFIAVIWFGGFAARITPAHVSTAPLEKSPTEVLAAVIGDVTENTRARWNMTSREITYTALHVESDLPSPILSGAATGVASSSTTSPGTATPLSPPLPQSSLSTKAPTTSPSR